mgnify:CR=1 FL=1
MEKALEHFAAILKEQMNRIANMSGLKTDFSQKDTITIGIIDGDGIESLDIAIAYPENLPTGVYTLEAVGCLKDANGKEIETWQSALQDLVYVSNLEEELRMDVYNEGVANVLMEIMETRK